MKALQVTRPRLFEPKEIPVPALPPDGPARVLVRTAWAMTCGSDIPFFTGNKRHRSYPLPPGAPIHECIGEVVESTGAGFRPGDTVLSIPEGDLGLAEYFVALASKTVVLDSAADDGGAACLIQPLSTVMNAIDRLGDLRGRSVAVVGLGSIGLMFCWLAKRGGAGAVIGIDPVAERCRFAETLGATQTWCCRGIEAAQRMRIHPDAWTPPDICVEAVGHQMDTLNDCLELVRKYGTVLAFGVPDQPVYALEYEVFFRKNAILMGTVTPDWASYLPRAHDLYLANRDTLSRLSTHRLPIREAQRAFELYERRGDGIVKAVLDGRAWQ